MAKVLFFGRLRDRAGLGEREVALSEVVALAVFRHLASAGDDDLEAALAAPSVRIAINATLAPSDAACSVWPSDEVAFMPPFSGG
ncbi:MAG: MoaD/ThiS family protein [Hyphomonadaceae bacterium]|nr:MoaD/ThiS family protein [Hyphomonadaceae bacterium]